MEDTVFMVLRLVIFLPAVILLIYVSLKYGGGKLQSLQGGKYISVLEKTPLSKDSSLIVVKIGEKGYVLSSTSSKTEVLMEVGKEELASIEEAKKIPQYKDMNEFIKDIKNKLKIKKED